MREAPIDEHMLDQIVGHTPLTVGGKYGIGARLNSLKRETSNARSSHRRGPATPLALRTHAATHPNLPLAWTEQKLALGSGR